MKKLFFLFLVANCILPTANCFSQNACTQMSGLPAEGRHGAAAFSIGSRAYFGTGHNNGGNVDVLFDDWWEFDPGTNSWTQKANFGPGPRKWSHGFSIGNFGYICSGEEYNQVEMDDLWEYSPITNTWTQKATFLGGVREGCASFTIGNKAYFGTGDWWFDMWEYDQATDSWSQIADYPNFSGQICCVGFNIGNKGYMGTGADGNFVPTNEWFEYNPTTNVWTQKANVPGPLRSGACGFGIGNKGYIAVGTDWPNSMTCYSDCYQFTPATNSWMRIQDFPGSARRFVSYCNTINRGYMCTGTNGINLADMWEFNPALATGINDNTPLEMNYSIFPNPFHESATLQLLANPNSELTFELFDIQGKKVQILSITQQTSTISRSNLPSGIYFYQLTSANKKIRSGKLIIE